MTFAYRTREIGSAVAGEDFTATRGSVTVAAGARRATFTVPILDDDLDEPDESFEVAVTMGAERVIATVTVADDDVPEVRIAIPAIAAETGYVFEGEDRDDISDTVIPRANWRLTRVTAVPDAELEPLTVNLRVTERVGDFVADRFEGRRDQIGDVTFASGATIAYFSPIADDDLDESHGVVGVWLEPGEGYVLGAPAHTGGEAAVRDDDGELVTYRFDPGALTVLEGRPRGSTSSSRSPTTAHSPRSRTSIAYSSEPRPRFGPTSPPGPRRRIRTSPGPMPSCRRR